MPLVLDPLLPTCRFDPWLLGLPVEGIGALDRLHYLTRSTD